ncbi:MAG: hypothetical protein WAN04_10880 [Candidatus Udaeobacter sp.]
MRINTAGLPSQFYSYWQYDGVGPMGAPTEYYIELFAKRGPSGNFYRSPDKDFYYACLGDVTAFRRFLHSEDRNGMGAPGEGWDADMVILILKYGDDRLADVLRSEKKAVRESVGIVLETQLKPEDRAVYPKTRSLYTYRWTRKT